MRPLYFRVQRFFCVLVQLAQTYMQDTFAGIDCSLLMIYSVNNIISIRDRDEAMRVEIEYIDNEEEHVVVYCKEKDEKVQLIINYVESMNLTMKGTFQDEIKLFQVMDVLYYESVDNKVYAYTSSQVIRVSNTLEKLESILNPKVFFRCSKSTIINIRCIQSLQSILGNRILANLTNQESIVVSRHYAKKLKNLLQEGLMNE